MSDRHKSPEEKKENFLERIVSMFMGGDDPEKEKRKLLKEIGKELKKKKYKFYKPSSGEAQPPMAKFFYNIYKVVGPAQVMLENAAASGVIRSVIIDHSLSEKQLEIRDELTEENIRARAKDTDTKTLASELKDKLATFFAGFKGEKVQEINSNYNLLQVFLQIVHFDYYFLLKKFDSGLPERDFNYSPKFEAINGEYVLDDLKDFLEVMVVIDKGADWDTLFDILKEYKNTEMVNRTAWKKTLRSMEQIQKEGVLELIVRHLSKDPYYKATSRPPDEKIVEEYLNKLKTQSEMAIQKILQERQNKKIEKLLQQIFGTTAIARTKNYTDKENLKFSKKMLGGYIYVQPINYVKAFLLDYFKRDIKTLIDLLLIRGKWSTSVNSQQLSDAFHSVMESSEHLLKFDESLGDDSERGQKLKAYMSKSSKDQNAVVSLRKILKEINDEALGIIQNIAQNLITIGKSLKLVLDDYEKKPHELILNWKEIEQYSEKEIKTHITEVYRKIYYFIQLLQFYVKKK
ncbi:MAG: DUF5312 family protein [Spirochaetia bacterium]